MSFMEPEIVEGDWLEVETRDGTWFIPGDLVPGDPADHWNDETEEYAPSYLANVQQYVEGRGIVNVTLCRGFGARLSAPGYLDCTDWAVFDTEEEANAYLDEMYGEESLEDEE